MNERARVHKAMLLLVSCLLPLVAQAQSTDPASASATRTSCNWQAVEQQMEFPPLASKGKVGAAKAMIHGSVLADGHIVVSYLETSDPAFNDVVINAVHATTCKLPAGTAINWPVSFAADADQTALLSGINLRRGGIDAAADQRRVLVLLPQGIDPSNDHDGLNDLSRRLTSALAARITENLRQQGIDVIAVLDQRPVGIQEKLETYAGSLLTRHILVVTVETVPIDDEQQLRYRVQYSDDDLIIKAGVLEAVLPNGTVAHTYKIKGSKSGAANISVEAIASEFVAGLSDDGRLKGLTSSH